MSADALLLAILRGWGNAVRELGQTLEIGPFLVTFHPDSELPWLNYAVPIRAEASEQELEAALPQLQEVFAERQRLLRFEILGDLFPSLAPRLEREGLTLQARLPLMVCTAEDLQPAAERGIEVELLSADISDQELSAYIRMRNAAFDAAADVDSASDANLRAEISRLRDELVAGKVRSARAFLDGALVGAGSLMAGGTVTELVAVATRADVRRRGVASAVSRFLVREHLQSGGTAVWLSAASDAARIVYAQIGFRRVAWQLNYAAASQPSLLSGQGTVPS